MASGQWEAIPRWPANRGATRVEFDVSTRMSSSRLGGHIITTVPLGRPVPSYMPWAAPASPPKGAASRSNPLEGSIAPTPGWARRPSLHPLPQPPTGRQASEHLQRKPPN